MTALHRNYGNRRRGRNAERAWAALINRGIVGTDLPLAEVVGLNRVDVVWHEFAFEVKHRFGGWPRPAVIGRAWQQAVRNSAGRIPIVVSCMTLPGGVRRWLVYTSEAAEPVDGKEWLLARLSEHLRSGDPGPSSSVLKNGDDDPSRTPG